MRNKIFFNLLLIFGIISFSFGQVNNDNIEKIDKIKRNFNSDAYHESDITDFLSQSSYIKFYNPINNSKTNNYWKINEYEIFEISFSTGISNHIVLYSFDKNSNLINVLLVEEKYDYDSNEKKEYYYTAYEKTKSNKFSVKEILIKNYNLENEEKTIISEIKYRINSNGKFEKITQQKTR